MRGVCPFHIVHHHLTPSWRVVQIERVVSQTEMEVNEGEEPVTKYLVKWEGLPYAECTWETMEDINQAGNAEEFTFFFVGVYWAMLLAYEVLA